MNDQQIQDAISALIPDDPAGFVCSQWSARLLRERVGELVVRAVKDDCAEINAEIERVSTELQVTKEELARIKEAAK